MSSILREEQNIKQNYLIPLSESKAKQWVEALPLTDIGEVTKRLFHGLVDINRRALPPLTRIRISEMLRPALEMTVTNLQRHLSYCAFPLPKRSQKIFELNQSLLLEFAGSYQLAALDMLTQNSISKRPLLIAIYHAIDYMGRVLISSYAMYMRTRDTIWHDIHQLYLVASEQNIDSVTFANGRKGANNITARYIQINVLALCKPYSLRQEEVTRVVRYLEEQAHHVTISREPEDIMGDYVHVAVLNSDEPAVIMPYGDLPHSPTVRVLNLQAMLRHLEDAVNTRAGGSALAIMSNGLSRNLVQRLIYNLTTVRNRSFNRFPRSEKITMVARLPEILKAIRHHGTEANIEQQREEDLLFDTMLFGESTIQAEQKKTAGQGESLSKKNDELALQVWHVMNNSVGGYGLRWPHAEPSVARVGEIVGLNAMNQESNPWMIGVIKWMEVTQEKTLCCGVELLSSKVLPLTLTQVQNRELVQALPIDGLMLPSIEGVRPDAVIILPAYIFHPNDIVTLKISGREEQVKLTVLDECLGSFAYFRFESCVTEEQKEHAEEFDSLWDDL